MTMTEPHLDALQLSAAADGEADAGAVAHLEVCAACRAQARTWTTVLTSVGDEGTTGEMPAEVGSRTLAAALAEAAAASHRRAERRRRRRHGLVAVMSTAAAAGLVALAVVGLHGRGSTTSASSEAAGVASSGTRHATPLGRGASVEGAGGGASPTTAPLTYGGVGRSTVPASSGATGSTAGGGAPAGTVPSAAARPAVSPAVHLGDMATTGALEAALAKRLGPAPAEAAVPATTAPRPPASSAVARCSPVAQTAAGVGARPPRFEALARFGTTPAEVYVFAVDGQWRAWALGRGCHTIAKARF